VFHSVAAVKPKTEEFLNFLLWNADKLMRPSYRHVIESYENWAYRNGLLRQVASLEHRQLIEARSADPDERLYRLTAQGRLQVLGGRDPQRHWLREWDGRWRLVLFDVPVARDSHRRRLRRYLHARGFGCLQGSVWITPDALEEEKELLVGAKIDAASMLLLDAKPCAGESDAEIVAKAWDFSRLNQRYTKLLEILDRRPEAPLGNEESAKAMLRWASAERKAWLHAVGDDPLLPMSLLPSNYLGQKAWRRRVEVLQKAGDQIQRFKIGNL